MNKLQGVEWDMQCQNIAVCDDEQEALAITGRYIRKNLGVCGIEAQVDEFLSADQMTEQMEKKIYQACFLDIDMPQINGIDLAERIIRRYAGIMVVFVYRQGRICISELSGSSVFVCAQITFSGGHDPCAERSDPAAV